MAPKIPNKGPGKVSRAFTAGTGGAGNLGELNRQGMLWRGRAQAKRLEARIDSLEENQTTLDNTIGSGSGQGGAVQALAELNKQPMLNPLNTKNITITQIYAGNSKKDILYAQKVSDKNLKLLGEFTKATKEIAENTKVIKKQDTKIKKDAGKSSGGGGAVKANPTNKMKSADDTSGTFMNTLKTMLQAMFTIWTAEKLGGLVLGVLGTVTGLKFLKKQIGKALTSFFDKKNRLKKIKELKKQKIKDKKAKVKNRAKDIKKIKKDKLKVEKKAARNAAIKKAIPKPIKAVGTKTAATLILRWNTSKTKEVLSKTADKAIKAKGWLFSMMDKIGLKNLPKVLKKIGGRAALLLFGPVGALIAAGATIVEIDGFIKWGLVELGFPEAYIIKFEDAVKNWFKETGLKAATVIGIHKTQEERTAGLKEFRKDKQVEELDRRIEATIEKLEILLEKESNNKAHQKQIYDTRAELLKLEMKYRKFAGISYAKTLWNFIGNEDELWYLQQIHIAQKQKSDLEKEKHANNRKKRISSVTGVNDYITNFGSRSIGTSMPTFNATHMPEYGEKESFSKSTGEYSIELTNENGKNYGNDGKSLNGLTPETLRLFNKLSANWGKKLYVTSAYRSPAYNKKVGGAKKSMHVQGKAIDINWPSKSQKEKERFVRLAVSIGFRGIGIYKNFMHVDTGNMRAWGSNGSRTTLPEWARLAIAVGLTADVKYANKTQQNAAQEKIVAKTEGTGNQVDKNIKDKSLTQTKDNKSPAATVVVQEDTGRIIETVHPATATKNLELSVKESNDQVVKLTQDTAALEAKIASSGDEKSKSTDSVKFKDTVVVT